MITFEITFHGPFHSFTGSAVAGVDATVDLSEPVRESALKGLMRAGATRLGIDPALIATVFGTGGGVSAGAWAWRVLPVSATPIRRTRGSVPIDDESGTARAGLLRFADELWSKPISFTVQRRDWVAIDDRHDHLQLLRSAARSVYALGHDRNRGFGWVSIAETGHDQVRPAELATWVIEHRGSVANNGPGPLHTVERSGS